MKIDSPFQGQRQHALDEIYARHGLQRRVEPEVTLKSIAKFVGAVIVGAVLLYLAACIRAL